MGKYGPFVRRFHLRCIGQKDQRGSWKWSGKQGELRRTAGSFHCVYECKLKTIFINFQIWFFSLYLPFRGRVSVVDVFLALCVASHEHAVFVRFLLFPHFSVFQKIKKEKKSEKIFSEIWYKGLKYCPSHKIREIFFMNDPRALFMIVGAATLTGAMRRNA